MVYLPTFTIKNQPHVGQIYHTWILGDIASSNFPVMKSSLWPSRVPSASSWLIWLRESAVVPYRSCHRASSTSCSLSSRGWWKHLLILHNVIVLMFIATDGNRSIWNLFKRMAVFKSSFDFIESRRVHSHLFRSGCCRLLHDIGLFCFHGPKIFSSAALHVFGWVWQAPFSFFFGENTYLEDHPRTCKSLGSLPFISQFHGHLEGK